MTQRDLWRELCDKVSEPDGLPIRECGAWTEDKLWFWHKYFSITTQAMVGHPKWKEGVAYVDLFCGPGICETREPKKRLPGSSLIAACTNKPFCQIVAIDLDPDSASACRVRLNQIAPNRNTHVIEGDSNVKIDEALERIPKNALTLAVLDPPGMDYHFQTIKKIASARRTDFLLLFADAIDAVRNLDLYFEQEESKLDHMLGSNWRIELQSLGSLSPNSVRQFLSDTLKRRFHEELGYEGFREKRINGPRGALYKLLFASKHERGVDFWDKIARNDRRGQGELF